MPETAAPVSVPVYAQVIIDISHERVDRPFTYRIPAYLGGKLVPGSRVVVPFGQGSRQRIGYVVGFADTCGLPPQKIKEILTIAPGHAGASDFGENAVKLAVWMKERYGSTTIQALKTVLPVQKALKPVEKRTIVLTADEETAKEALAVFGKKHQVARERLLGSLIETPRQPYRLVTDKLHIAAATVKSLESQGLITVEKEELLRNPVRGAVKGAGEKPELSLNEGQRKAVDGVLADFDSGCPSVSLIRGITGSGKTEVYIRIIEGIVARGRQAIMLIPEIALTYQTLIRFYRHFGDRVSVMNSTLSPGEKYDQYERARRGEIDVIIGPRSALFTPFSDPGVIVIDEEHENSYKNETMPKYHARDVAIKIASMHGACVVLGSATPSLESCYRAETGEYKLYELPRRATGSRLPDVKVVDMREELRMGNRSIFSDTLQSLMEDRLAKHEQTMLFLNRRGVAGFVSCRSCGHVMKCPHCDVSLTQHADGRLVCHYCGYEQPAVRICPVCGSRYIAGFRAGTEKIEQEVRKMFPAARVLRMDGDTTKHKDSYEKILTAFSNEEADILIGTQMIVKGHDFPGVTLVGMLSADLSLNASDYRAGERTFELLTQAAGRAGRGAKPGTAVIQTYDPDNYAIRYAAKQDYRGFYEEELQYRQMLCYPPVWHMLAVQITDPDEDTALALAGEIRGMIGRLQAEAEKAPGGAGILPQRDESGGAADSADGTIIIGPSGASLSRVRDISRFVLYCKNAKYDTLIRYKDRIEAGVKRLGETSGRFRKSQVQFDFDPVSPY